VLDVLAERDDGQAGAGAAQFYGGAQPFVGEGRGHPDVGDHQVGGMRSDGSLEGLGVAHRGCGLEAEPFEQPGQALAQQDSVLGQDYPDGAWF
jgi:hypothetical protein